MILSKNCTNNFFIMSTNSTELLTGLSFVLQVLYSAITLLDNDNYGTCTFISVSQRFDIKLSQLFFK